MGLRVLGPKCPILHFTRRAIAVRDLGSVHVEGERGGRLGRPW
jgi:hypothetical protein